jgi:hypothetical protein
MISTFKGSNPSRLLFLSSQTFISSNEDCCLSFWLCSCGTLRSCLPYSRNPWFLIGSIYNWSHPFLIKLRSSPSIFLEIYFTTSSSHTDMMGSIEASFGYLSVFRATTFRVYHLTVKYWAYPFIGLCRWVSLTWYLFTGLCINVCMCQSGSSDKQWITNGSSHLQSNTHYTTTKRNSHQ